LKTKHLGVESYGFINIVNDVSYTNLAHVELSFPPAIGSYLAD
jgi:hypothetical protein